MDLLAAFVMPLILGWRVGGSKRCQRAVHTYRDSVRALPFGVVTLPVGRFHARSSVAAPVARRHLGVSWLTRARDRRGCALERSEEGRVGRCGRVTPCGKPVVDHHRERTRERRANLPRSRWQNVGSVHAATNAAARGDRRRPGALLPSPAQALFQRSRKRGISSGIHVKPCTEDRMAAYSAPNNSGTIGRSVTICCCASA